MIKKIVNEIIRKESRQEAINVLNQATNDEINEFINYYNDEKHNICCLVIDTIKDRLISENKMSSDGDFGNLLKKLYDNNDNY